METLVFMVDAEGFGRRDRPRPRPFTMGDYVAPAVAPVKITKGRMIF